MSIYYALAGWSGNRERRDERTKRKREKEKGIIHYSLVCIRLSRLRTSHLTVLFHGLFLTVLLSHFFSSVAQQNPYLLQARRKELRSKNTEFRSILNTVEYKRQIIDGEGNRVVTFRT
ncbi:hypothetical protein EVAR_81875_1 [Eumeta japonica]|uniref:Uncharacterized protein n=1 Tax=Eumeta variegata TaxID=151549 RepID=A0A4C1UY95_EUMVA|nr:hypothetical protein EVAR_81875_1 [Eumeta japonica]